MFYYIAIYYNENVIFYDLIAFLNNASKRIRHFLEYFIESFPLIAVCRKFYVLKHNYWNTDVEVKLYFT